MIHLVREQMLLSHTARGLMRQAVDDVAQGHCHLLLRPALVDGVAFSHAVLEELERRHFRYVEVDARLIDAKRLPSALFEHLGIARSLKGGDPFDVLQDGLVDVDVLHLVGLDELPAESQRRWLELAVMWGRCCQRQDETGHRTNVLFGVVLLEPSLLGNVCSDIRFTLAWWWGIPSSLEFHLLCRTAEDGCPPGPEAAWREHQAASLASGDASFLVHVWPFLASPQADLLARINEYARHMGWTAAQLRQWMALASRTGINGSHRMKISGIAAIEPPAALRLLWSNGAVYYAREHGCELHTAALAALGDQPGLSARLWRGQATLILPRLDATRHQLCRQLTDRHGKDWPTRWCTPESSEERAEVLSSPFACQWGYLRHLLCSVAQLRCERRFLPLAKVACDLRNDLAHCRPVEFYVYQQFAERAEELLDVE